MKFSKIKHGSMELSALIVDDDDDDDELEFNDASTLLGH